MREVFGLVKILLKQRYSGNKTAKNDYKKISLILIVVSLCFLSISVASAMALYAGAAKEAQVLTEFLLLLMASVSVMLIVFSSFAIVSFVYFNKDVEFLASLPLKTHTVFLAKLLVVFLEDLILATIFLLPSLLALGLFAGVNVLYFLSIPFILIIVPLTPLLLTAILSAPLLHLFSFFKKRGAYATILLTVAFCVGFSLFYYYQQSFLGGMTEINDETIKMILPVANIFKFIFYPLYELSRFATAKPYGGMNEVLSLILSFVAAVGLTAVLVVLSCVLLNLFYRRGVSMQIEGAGGELKKKGEFKASSIQKTLIKREFLDILRNPMLGFNCLGGLVMCPLIILVMKFTMGGMPTTEEDSQIVTFVFDVSLIFIFLMLSVGMNVAAATMISREGKNYYFLKYLPINFTDIIAAKRRLYTIISLVNIVVSAVALFFVLENPMTAVFAFGFSLIYNHGFISFSMYNDLKNPNLEWSSPNEIMKNSMNTSVPMLANMVVSMVLTVPISIVYIAYGSNIAANILLWSILYLFAGVVTILMKKLIDGNAEKLFDRIE